MSNISEKSSEWVERIQKCSSKKELKHTTITIIQEIVLEGKEDNIWDQSEILSLRSEVSKHPENDQQLESLFQPILEKTKFDNQGLI